MLDTNGKPSEVLASWTYEPELWRDFLEYDSSIYKGSVRAAKHAFLVALILTLGIPFLIVVISFLVMDKWNSSVLNPAIAFAILGWIFVIATGIFWLWRRDRFNRLQERNGEVVISLNGVSTNGVEFNWDFEEIGVRFNKVERKSVSLNLGNKMEILEFHTVNFVKIDTGAPMREDFEQRVPIPFGKESEAERVISRLNTHLSSVNQEWIRANVALGHIFSENVCRNCDNDIAKLVKYTYECRK